MNPNELYQFPVHGPDGRIARLRRWLALKQSEFAEAVGVSRETVSHWENLDDQGKPKQRTQRNTAAAIAQLTHDRLGWDVDSSFFHRDGGSPLEQLLQRQKNSDARLEELFAEIRELHATLKNGSAGAAAKILVAQRFKVGDVVGWCDPTDTPDELGTVLAVEDLKKLWLDFYCDPCDVHWSVPDEDGWRERIANTGDYPACPANDSLECDRRRKGFIMAVRASQNVTVDFGGRWGGPAAYTGDHLRLITRTV